jgi:hypothetical protein
LGACGDSDGGSGLLGFGSTGDVIATLVEPILEFEVAPELRVGFVKEFSDEGLG